ncbi:MAG TPA: glycine cleavage system protein H [Pirellulales bacterium]|jgi:glycine cleavage system H protein|nr:glycine cleavage system protein H [Pirellulales bacterium]
MSEELVFLMGQFAARFPVDRRYAKNHMWAKPAAEGGRFRFGFAAYAVRLLQDVYFLEWSVDAPAPLREKQAIGAIESSKAESELYAPMTGRLVEFNENLLSDPSGINVDPYGEGWLFAMEGPGEGLLSPEEYLVHLAASWTIAERTIKGQINESE